MYDWFSVSRAVANGPVGPAMAGPIIEPANCILFFYFLNFLKKIIIFFGRNNNRTGIFFDIMFETETTQSPTCALSRFDFRPFPSIPCRQSSSFDGWKGPQVHEFVGLYSDPQCDAGTITEESSHPTSMKNKIRLFGV